MEFFCAPKSIGCPSRTLKLPRYDRQLVVWRGRSRLTVIGRAERLRWRSLFERWF